MIFKDLLPSSFFNQRRSQKLGVTSKLAESNFTTPLNLSTFNQTQKGYLLTLSQRITLGVIILATILLLLYSWQSWQMTHLNSKLIDVTQELEVLKKEKMSLKFKINQAFNLERIERLAKKELGMIEPEEIRWLKLKESS